jgi:membrane dipeptidase
LNLIVDGHQDLAWNMATFGRDYTRSVDETRLEEQGTDIPTQNGDTLLGWPEYRDGKVAVIFASLFAAPIRWQDGLWDTQVYKDVLEANKLYRAQVDLYYRLADDHPDKFNLIFDQADLQAVLAGWHAEAEDFKPVVGLVLQMENAGGVRAPAELAEWWELGVRILGPAWAENQYTGGTHEPGPLTSAGFELLEIMADLGMVLDVSHMDEKALLQSLDFYPGVVVASHSNAAALIADPGNRYLTDRAVYGLIEREGVIGIIPGNDFLLQDWKARGGRQSVSIARVVDQVDHICQIAGDARHAAIGSDFDGGFGWQAVPGEIDSIADLQKLVPLLRRKGYTEEDIHGIMGENWLAVLERSLPS